MYSLAVTYSDGDRLIADLHRDGVRVAYVSDNGMTGTFLRFDSAAERHMYRLVASERYDGFTDAANLYLAELLGR